VLEISPVQFKKPPVVEAWIEFKFALTQEDSVWDEDKATTLVKTRFADYTPESFSKYAEIHVDARTGKANVQELFDRIRSFSAEKDRCIQARRNVFVFNQLNRAKWLGYGAMADAAIEAAAHYMEFRGFDELTNVSLHYRDIVAIPRPNAKEGLRLPDWFRIYPEVPQETLGTMSSFRFDVQVPELCKDADARLSIQSLPCVAQEETDFRFSLDWHVTSADNTIREIEAARGWLDSAHDTLRSSFEKAFTPACLQLFEPLEGD
jgi:uncharacterized protein (TIGR04255 family)